MTVPTVDRSRADSLLTQAVARALAKRQMAINPPAPPRLPAGQQAALDACRASFAAFLPYWRFINRESGEVQSFAELWPGQEEMRDAMIAQDWLFILKAGKLGATELECAFDAWKAIFCHRNALVGILSKELKSARQLLKIVKFGIRNLPEWMRPRTYDGAGSDTLESLMLAVGPEDTRTIISYSTKTTVAIDVTLHHAHIDEMSHMVDPEAVWDSVSTVISPEGGTCHIVTRGAGPDKYTADLWAQAHNLGGSGRLFGLFVDWRRRPREEGWYELESGTRTRQGTLHFAPETAEDALAGDDTADYIPLPVWDACADPDLPELVPGSSEPIILAVDAAVTGDCYGIVAVTRHPLHRERAAIRAARKWTPPKDGRIDFSMPERFIRFMCQGGCRGGHPRELPLVGIEGVDDCSFCVAGDFSVPKHNVLMVVIDPYQLEDLAQTLEREGIVWVDKFPQMGERLIADGLLFKLAIRGEVAHPGKRYGCEHVREHIGNARAKLQQDDDSRMRIVKRSEKLKIDLAVAASMGIQRCLTFNMA